MRPAMRLAAALLAAGGCTAQITRHDITVVNPSALPATIAATSRISIGVRGDYKPWVTQLQNGELLMVHRCNNPEANCTPMHAVIWRSPADGSNWSRTEHVMQKSPPASDLSGGEWSVNTLSDGTVFMLNGGCDYFYSKDNGHSFVAK